MKYKDVRVLTFFYGFQTQTEREEEINRFLSCSDIKVIDILQSSVGEAIALTILYRKV